MPLFSVSILSFSLLPIQKQTSSSPNTLCPLTPWKPTLSLLSLSMHPRTHRWVRRKGGQFKATCPCLDKHALGADSRVRLQTPCPVCPCRCVAVLVRWLVIVQSVQKCRLDLRCCWRNASSIIGLLQCGGEATKDFSKLHLYPPAVLLTSFVRRTSRIFDVLHVVVIVPQIAGSEPASRQFLP